MRFVVLLLSVAVLAACSTSTGGQQAGGPAQSQAASDQAALAAELEGRTAEAPVECVNERDLGATRPIGRGVILFGSSNDEVVFVNRPPKGCAGLDAGRSIKVQTPATRICRGDIITVFDAMGGIALGSCGLGTFTPYRRTAK
jgi:hypothetical protein